MFRRIKEDENLRQWWWAHTLHWFQGWFVAGLIGSAAHADNLQEALAWCVAAFLFGGALYLYQKTEYDVLKDRTGRGDRIIRDWKVITFGFTAGLLYYFVTGWTLIEGVKELWQLIP